MLMAVAITLSQGVTVLGSSLMVVALVSYQTEEWHQDEDTNYLFLPSQDSVKLGVSLLEYS